MANAVKVFLLILSGVFPIVDPLSGSPIFLPKHRLLGIDDKNRINACKLLGIPFTTAVGILIRSREKGLVQESEALEKLALLAKYGRYKDSIIEDARRKLEAKP